MRTFAIVNMKGGVAKTTTACNMAYLLAQSGKRVLLIDNDIQGNASAFYEQRKTAGAATVADVFRGAPIREAIRQTRYRNLSVVMGDMDLATVNMELMARRDPRAATILQEALADIRQEYDFAIIDCAPNMTPNVINAFLAATDVIVPLEIDGFSIDGLREVESRVLEARAAGHDVRLTGVLVTKFNGRTKMDREGLQFLRTKTKFPVFHNVIHMSIKVKESVFQHRPVVEYARKCRPAQDYRAFVEELVPNLGTEQEGALV